MGVGRRRRHPALVARLDALRFAVPLVAGELVKVSGERFTVLGRLDPVLGDVRVERTGRAHRGPGSCPRRNSSPHDWQANPGGESRSTVPQFGQRGCAASAAISSSSTPTGCPSP